MFGLRIFSLDHTLSRIRVSLLGTHQTIFCKTPPGLRFMYLTTFMSQAALNCPGTEIVFDQCTIDTDTRFDLISE